MDCKIVSTEYTLSFAWYTRFKKYLFSMELEKTKTSVTKIKKIKPRTRLEQMLMPFNKDCGEVDSGWGAIPVMIFFIIMFVLFLVILLQIYNSSIILTDVDIDWSGLEEGSPPKANWFTEKLAQIRSRCPRYCVFPHCKPY